MPFPPRGLPATEWEPGRWPILVTDRGREHFGAGHSHYAHYAEQYRAIFDRVKPALVMGEATLFHELLAVQEARSRNIPYLHPSAERYPQDRFCFFHDMTQHAFGGSGEDYLDATALEFAEKIAGGGVALAYMRSRGRVGQFWSKLNWAWTRLRVFAARTAGERYNTPSALHKWRLHRKVRANLADWNQLARSPKFGERTILYPMQMAPEANIDVWGRPHNDQIGVIKALLQAAPADVKIALKCNPKPKYELSGRLLSLAKSDERIILLPLSMPMAEAMTKAIGAVTVCGTVGFEAVFGRGRCISLRHPVITHACPSLAAATPQEAVSRLLEDPVAGIGSPELAVRLLKKIHSRSYPGFISDPYSSPTCLKSENVELVANAIADISGRLATYPSSQDIPL